MADTEKQNNVSHPETHQKLFPLTSLSVVPLTDELYLSHPPALLSRQKLLCEEEICMYTVLMVRTGNSVGHGMNHSSGLPRERRVLANGGGC